MKQLPLLIPEEPPAPHRRAGMLFGRIRSAVCLVSNEGAPHVAWAHRDAVSFQFQKPNHHT